MTAAGSMIYGPAAIRLDICSIICPFIKGCPQYIMKEAHLP